MQDATDTMNTRLPRDFGGSLALQGGTGGITAMCPCGDFLEVYKEDMTYRIRTPESIDPDRTNPNAPVVAAVADTVGSSNPAVARVLLQGRDIVEGAIFANDVNKSAIIGELHTCKEALFVCEKALGRVAASVDRIIEEIKTRGIKRDSGGRALNPLPQVPDLDGDATAFLINAKRAIQSICKLPAIILSVPAKDNNFDYLAKTLTAKVGAHTPITQFVSNNADPVRHFIDLRNWQEHPNAKRTIIENFAVAPDGSIVVPMWSVSGQEPLRIREDMLAGQSSLIQIAEWMLIHAVLHAADKRIPFVVVETEILNPALPVRYRLSVDESRLGGGS